MDAKQRYRQWLQADSLDEDTRAELVALADDPEELVERFGQELQFGTGGLRGILGTGSARMNIYNVRRASQALANCLRKNSLAERGVAIAYDSRRMSRRFAEETGCVLAANQIPVYFFGDVTPTPVLSFAVREIGTAAGVVITASHNPPEYNGFKVYREDGVQILPEMAELIAQEMAALTIDDVCREEALEDSPFFRPIDKQLKAKYLQRVVESLPDKLSLLAEELAILYTPLHGTGGDFVPPALRQAGFRQVDVVEAQMAPDGEFPTVAYPNPEEPDCFACAFKQAGAGKYDLILATDPDADRLGVAVWHGGEYRLLNGNQLGVLLADFLLGHSQQPGAVVKTIVTTEMIRPLAAQYGATVIDTLTGFKYIGDLIGRLEQAGKQFVFGFEESYGFLAGSNLGRDKDAVMASVLTAALAAQCQVEGKTLLDRLDELMQEHGYYLEKLVSFSYGSLSEAQQAQEQVEKLRCKVWSEIAGIPLRYFRDYARGTERDIGGDKETPLNLPRENVIQWETVQGDRITIRPSGTEPKLKLYVGAVAETKGAAEARLSRLEQALVNQLKVKVDSQV